ncbi:hypothetical protein HOA59_02600 [archaeon]|jgi:flagellin-like protein|nr:hypothetical protein [archaeon]MBT6824302.1 hypothetical protein [archaeon]MBT7107418.1 hypothetical protein [archaeon]MBT7297347.1 hypothetical protein [archaeon]
MLKRGISPLISTVLLVGFTIVLTSIIFLFVQSVFDNAIEDNNVTSFSCTTDVSLSYQNFCIDNETVRLNIENNVGTPIDNFIFLIFDSLGTSSINTSVGLGPYNSANFYFPYNITKTYDKLEIYPILFSDGEVLSCSESPINISSLDICTSSIVICGDNFVNQINETCDGVDAGTCDTYCASFGETYDSCDDYDSDSDGDLCECICSGGFHGSPPITFEILEGNLEEDFWYPLMLTIKNNDITDIQGFKILINGDSGSDEYFHTSGVFSGETETLNVFHSAKIGDINYVELTPGTKESLSDGSVDWTWYDDDKESYSSITDSSNWSNVLGYWTFKESSGYDVYDHSPYGSICSIDPAETPVWKVDKYCLFGRCYYLDGANEGLNCSAPTHFDTEVSDEITIEAVIRPWRIMDDEGVAKNRLIASKYYDDVQGERAWVFRLDEDLQNLYFRIYSENSEGLERSRTIELNISDGDSLLTIGAIWHHVVAQYSNSLNIMKFYIDGELVKEQSFGSYDRPIIDSPISAVMIGDWQNWGGDTFNGRMESVAIYNEFIDETRIKEHANSLFNLANCPREKRTNEPDYCEHLGHFGINDSVNINDPSGEWYVEDSKYYGLKEYINFSNPSNCDVAIMAVHGGSMEIGTEQMARYIYENLTNSGQDVALWVYGSRNTGCSMCGSGCEESCHHVTSGAMNPNCDPYLKEILSECKIGIALHGCDSGCQAGESTNYLDPILIGGRSDYALKQYVVDALDSNVGGDYYLVNFDDIQDCKFYFDEVSCYRGADHCNIVNQFPKFNELYGLPGIQIEMPPSIRINASVLLEDSVCDVANPPAGCFSRFENEDIWGDTLLAADAYISAVNNYISYKGW